MITAIGQPGTLSVDFAANDGGSYLQSLKVNYQIRSDLEERDVVVVPGEPALSVQKARPVQSAVTTPAPRTPAATNPATTPASQTPPRTTETSP